MSNEQEPVVHIGTVLCVSDCGGDRPRPVGTVVAIRKDGVDLNTPQGVKTFSLSKIEEFVDAN